MSLFRPPNVEKMLEKKDITGMHPVLRSVGIHKESCPGTYKFSSRAADKAPLGSLVAGSIDGSWEIFNGRKEQTGCAFEPNRRALARRFPVYNYHTEKSNIHL